MTARADAPPAGVAAAPAQRARPVAVIGNLPPPVTGAAAVTAAAAARFARTRRTLTASLSPGAARGPLRHPVRLLRTLAAMATLLRLRLLGGRTLYLALDGGAGRLYQIALLLVARGLGLAPTVHHHSWTYLDRPDATQRLLLAAGGPRLRHVFLSPGMQARFERAYGPAPAALTLPNAGFLPRPRTARPPRAPGAALRVGLLANLTRAKGLHEMIALAREIARRGLPAEIRLAGPVRDPADRAALEAALADPALALAWDGPRHGAAKDAWYAAIDLFCLPTTHPDEAQPLVLYEAALAGVPALAWARGAIPEQLDAPEAALPTHRPFAPWAADRIAALIAEPARLAARAAAARARAEDDAARAEAAMHRLLAADAPGEAPRTPPGDRP